MKLPAYLTVTAAAIVALRIALHAAERPVSAPAAGFMFWTLSPYIGLMLLLKAARQQTAVIKISILAALIAGFGLWVYIDAMFIHLDAQSALVFAIVPLWQWALILISCLLNFLIKITIIRSKIR